MSIFVATIKREFLYKGRLNRFAYLWRGVVYALLAVVFLLIASLPSVHISFEFAGVSNTVVFFTGLVGCVLMIWLFVAASIKRMHDIGWPGWWFPLAAFILGFVWCTLEDALGGRRAFSGDLFQTTFFFFPRTLPLLGLLLLFMPNDKSANKLGPVVASKKR